MLEHSTEFFQGYKYRPDQGKFPPGFEPGPPGQCHTGTDYLTWDAFSDDAAYAAYVCERLQPGMRVMYSQAAGTQRFDDDVEIPEGTRGTVLSHHRGEENHWVTVEWDGLSIETVHIVSIDMLKHASPYLPKRERPTERSCRQSQSDTYDSSDSSSEGYLKWKHFGDDAEYMSYVRRHAKPGQRVRCSLPEDMDRQTTRLPVGLKGRLVRVNPQEDGSVCVTVQWDNHRPDYTIGAVFIDLLEGS